MYHYLIWREENIVTSNRVGCFAKKQGLDLALNLEATLDTTTSSNIQQQQAVKTRDTFFGKHCLSYNDLSCLVIVSVLFDNFDSWTEMI